MRTELYCHFTATQKEKTRTYCFRSRWIFPHPAFSNNGVLQLLVGGLAALLSSSSELCLVLTNEAEHAAGLYLLTTLVSNPRYLLPLSA